MNKLVVILLAGCFTVASAHNSSAEERVPHRIMTANIRVTGLPEDAPGTGRAWEERRDICVEVIRSRKPDIICMQEVIYDSYDYMKEQFAEYMPFGFEGPEMDPYTAGYHFIAKNVIFFSRDRYEFVSAGCYWLSETPLIAGSGSWNTMRARHCNWVRLRDKATGSQFRVLNLHLDHKSDEAKCEQMRLVIEESAQYAADFPQIICGDFNAGREHAAVKELHETGWSDTYEQIHGTEEVGRTAHGFKGADHENRGRRIDFIFVRGGIEPLSAEIIRDQINGIYPSDHYFVSAEVLIP